ncbi:OprO/OprP family phosphate-selective porin [Ectothiorhodospira mobilis]|uniref:OprO/OprP family phosphate-selective porin n=1 Tax=Ectothiorhodospira mobilis TaxID=195064 RepID=UPI001EE7A10D|nr:OprO/OprP family phosphate-selective porin [Ectothiorhodospira mobilis]MCG5536206.1 OprO/OprP family phosphate-selective porin [Ectothiorhodospira mobilis]
MNTLAKGFLGCALILSAAPLGAGEGPLSVHGFVSQGYLQSSHNNYYGESTRGSWDLTELGVNARYSVRPALSLAAQVVSRRAGEMYDGDPRLDYGFADLRYLDGTTLAGVRIGRSKIPIGFFNETRDVAATRPGILLPQSIYVEGLGIRDFYTGVDGINAYWQWLRDHGSLQLDLGVAVPADLQDETKAAFLRLPRARGDLELDEGQNLRLLYEDAGGRLRLAATYSRVRTRYRPGVEDSLGAGRTDVDALVLSGEWNRERYSLTAEGVMRELHTRDYGIVDDREVTEAGFYVQGTWRPRWDWSVFLRYDRHWDDLDDRDGRRQSALFDTLPNVDRAPHRFFQHQWTLGADWQPDPAWLLRAEWHHIHGTALTPALDNPAFDDKGGRARWDLFALQVSYMF